MTGLSITAASVAGLLAKATLVFSLALVFAWLARGGSARTLHALWTTTFVVLLALPALTFLGPSWAVPVLPNPDAEAESLPLAAPADEAPAGGLAGQLVDFSAGSGSLVPDSRDATSREARPVALTHGTPERTSAPLSPAGVAFIIWALGSAAALISLAVGATRFRKLARRASPLEDPAWVRQTNTIRWRLGLRTEVGLLASETVPTPMTGGLLKPVILLPSSAETWTPERRAVVLAHELVHIRRQDAFRQIVGRAVVAFYWFHPLSWLASRFANIARERSCDEEVLALGTRPSEYARHLFSLASATVGGSTVLALPMVQRSQLENRIMSILKQHRPGYSAARTSTALFAVGATGFLIACANPVPRESAEQPSPTVEVRAPGDLSAENSAIRVSDPEPTVSVDPVPEASTPATPPLEPAPRPDPQSEAAAAPVPQSEPAPPVALAPEVIGSQELECNLGGSGTIVRRGGGELTLQRRVDGMRLCMRSRGNGETVYAGSSLESMDDGSSLVLESQAERLHRLVATASPNGLEHDWSIDGRSHAFDAEAEEWRDLMLTVMQGYLEAQEVLVEEGGLRWEMGSHERHVAGLRRQIGGHGRHVASLRRQIGAHERHVAGLRRQIGADERHVASLRRGIVSHERHVAGLHQTMARMISVETQDALRATTQALEQFDLRELESATQALLQEFDEESLRELDEDVRQMVEDALRLREEVRNAVATQLAELQVEAVRTPVELASLRQAIEEYDLDRRVREIEGQIEQYDLDGKVEDIEAEIEQYDLDGKVREIEAEIEQYDLDGKIRDIEAQIEELDADRRIDEIERSLLDEIAAIRRLIG